jgi:hypothetical protein
MAQKNLKTSGVNTQTQGGILGGNFDFLKNGYCTKILTISITEFMNLQICLMCGGGWEDEGAGLGLSLWWLWSDPGVHLLPGLTGLGEP